MVIVCSYIIEAILFRKCNKTRCPYVGFTIGQLQLRKSKKKPVQKTYLFQGNKN